ncbi:MAG: beta-ketoacyl-ACP synthase 3 [Bacteroidales bacterium]|nr:beta-ketoacyl-ACP synthase 3 [Bacteroidales bacterium]
MKIIGTGSALPRKVVTNDDLSQFLDTSDEWIFPRTGIRTRHVITDEKLEDLGMAAACAAIAQSGLQVGDIDMFICSNVVNEYLTPGLSCIIAAGIGLRCPCIDINCACPGFIYAMDIADTYIAAGRARNVLVVCAEEPTRMTSWEDRSTCVLFGDGAGAAVFTAGDNVKGIKLNAEPSVDKIWQYRPLEPTPYVRKTETNVPLQMNGREVFRFAVTTSVRDINEILAKEGMTASDVDYFMIHQANMRIIEGIRGRLGVPEEKFPTNIQDHGNSSSASCPILLDECNRKGLFKKGDKIVFSAFGAGLLSAVALMEW